jgi:nucleoside-diphosphate-sugar epimerase
MNILITGGGGYIGSVLVPMLLAKGHRVTVIDNFMYGQTSLLDVCWSPNLEVHRADARDTKFVLSHMRKADAILPLACLVGAPLCAADPGTAQAVNFDAVKAIEDNRSPDQMMVFPNTNSGYGSGVEAAHCDENSPLNPISLYGRLKVELEELLLLSGECVTFRFATVFGVSPRMRLDLLVNDFTYRAVRDRSIVLFEPHFKRNYLHVRDAARAFIHALENYEQMKGRSYNVGLSDANLSKLELCEAIQKHIPEFRIFVSDIGEDPDKRNYIVSNERIEGTGFRTSVSLDDGIEELIKGYEIVHSNQFTNV